MNKEIQPDITNIDVGRLAETIYVTIQLKNEEEIEFTRYTCEENGSVVAHDLTIEDEDQQKIFDNLSEDEQEEIEELVRSVGPEDY